MVASQQLVYLSFHFKHEPESVDSLPRLMPKSLFLYQASHLNLYLYQLT